MDDIIQINKQAIEDNVVSMFRVFDNSISALVDAKIVVDNGERLPKVGDNINLSLTRDDNETRIFPVKIIKIVDIEKLEVSSLIEGVVISIKAQLKI